MSKGTFPMSFTLMGRPYPVTQHTLRMQCGLDGALVRAAAAQVLRP